MFLWIVAFLEHGVILMDIITSAMDNNLIYINIIFKSIDILLETQKIQNITNLEMGAAVYKEGNS